MGKIRYGRPYYRSVQRNARFHYNYLRAKQSNIIHRSKKEGVIAWVGGKIVFWYVKPACPLARFTNPLALDADGVRNAEPVEVSYGPEVIVLCSRCFPTGTGQHTPLELIEVP